MSEVRVTTEISFYVHSDKARHLSDGSYHVSLAKPLYLDPSLQFKLALKSFLINGRVINVPKADFDIDGKSYQIPASNCANEDELLSKLNAVIGEDLFDFNEIGLVVVQVAKTLKIYSRHLGRMLGFHALMHQPKTGHVTADQHVNLDLGLKSVYLESDLVQETIFGNETRRLIAPIPLTLSGRQSVYEPRRLLYCVVSDVRIQEFQFQLKTAHGEPVNFEKGATIEFVLLLRRRAVIFS